MDVNTFQRRYHEYAVATREEALAELEGMEIVEGHQIVVVQFPGLGHTLMLDTAADEITRLGII